MRNVKEKAIKLMLNSELLGFKLRFAFILVTIFLILSKAIKKIIVMKNQSTFTPMRQS